MFYSSGFFEHQIEKYVLVVFLEVFCVEDLEGGKGVYVNAFWVSFKFFCLVHQEITRSRKRFADIVMHGITR